MQLRVYAAAVQAVVFCVIGGALLVFRPRLIEVFQTLYYNNEVFPDSAVDPQSGWFSVGAIVLGLLLIATGLLRLFVRIAAARRRP